MVLNQKQKLLEQVQSKEAKGSVLKLDACQSLYLTFKGKTYINVGLKFRFGDGITVGFGLDFYLPVLEVFTLSVQVKLRQTSKSQIKLFTHAQY